MAALGSKSNTGKKKFSQNVANYTKSFGILYPRKDMAQELENDADLKIFNEALPNTKTWYMINGAQVKLEFAKILDDTNTIAGSDLANLERSVQEVAAGKGNI